MSGYHPDALKIAIEAFLEIRGRGVCYAGDPTPDFIRCSLDAIEDAGFMIVDARGSESITLETKPEGEQS